MYILKHLQGPESEELAAASKMEDGISFYQTACPDVAKLFHIDPQEKRPAIVLLKKEAEKLATSVCSLAPLSFSVKFSIPLLT